MVRSSKILAFAGSTRRDSFNKRLVRIAAEGARAAGVEVNVIDLKSFPLPLFDEDLEAADGPPAQALELKRLMIEHDGFLISSPEYNSSLSAVLKNAIDWVSRPAEGQPPMAAFVGKAAALMSASPGALGGLRGLVHLRAILSNMQVLVLPDQVAIPKAFEAFSGEGCLNDERQQGKTEGVGRSLAETLAKLRV